MDPEALRAEIEFYKAQLRALGDDLYVAHMEGCTILAGPRDPNEPITVRTLPIEMID